MKSRAPYAVMGLIIFSGLLSVLPELAEAWSIIAPIAFKVFCVSGFIACVIGGWLATESPAVRHAVLVCGPFCDRCDDARRRKERAAGILRITDYARDCRHMKAGGK